MVWDDCSILTNKGGQALKKKLILAIIAMFVMGIVALHDLFESRFQRSNSITPNFLGVALPTI